MKRITFSLVIALLVMMTVAIMITIKEAVDCEQSSSPEEFYVGMEVSYGTVDDFKKLIDKVKNYTNLLIIDNPLEIVVSETKLNEVCEYAYDAGLNFIAYLIPPGKVALDYDPYQWVAMAKKRYGDRFLGVYNYDEPGGNQLDHGRSMLVPEAENYTDAADIYKRNLVFHIRRFIETGTILFTSDYALYWFDYEAEYDVVLAEYAWNLSRPLQTALCRGAARMHGKDWGVMITWTYLNPPYIVSGDELHDDMLLAYQAGAKYVVIFNYPKISQYGILNEEHFEALKRFWNYVQSNPKKHGTIIGERAYVLPRDYGWGLRFPNDSIWGLWETDDISGKIWNDVDKLLQQYDFRLDIIYDYPEFYDTARDKYHNLIFWNGTVA